MATVHTFSGNPFDRADALRRDEAAIADSAASADSRYLPLWNLSVLVRLPPKGQNGEGENDTPTLGWLQQPDVARLGADVAPVLLGIEAGRVHFAIDVSDFDDPMRALNLGDDCQFDDARRAAMVLPAHESGILAQARSQLDWHRRHQFCSVCG
ncbi:MAG: NUDIX-like domain-containing protein, partial [Pseudomonadales bacterium]